MSSASGSGTPASVIINTRASRLSKRNAARAQYCERNSRIFSLNDGFSDIAARASLTAVATFDAVAATVPIVAKAPASVTPVPHAAKASGNSAASTIARSLVSIFMLSPFG